MKMCMHMKGNDGFDVTLLGRNKKGAKSESKQITKSKKGIRMLFVLID